MASSGSSPIRDFYRGKSVLITGATGLVGKVLVEKLLRSCPEIQTIYILLRPKRGQDIRRRVETLISAKLFDCIRAENPASLNKIIPIEGDIGQPNVGISLSDEEKMRENVSIVFHSAANLRYDGPLKELVNMNTRGTIRLMEMAQKFTRLDAFVFISSISSFCYTRQIGEKIYPLSTDPDKAIDCIEWMDNDMLQTLRPKLLGSHDASYPYSKALTEHAVMKMEGKIKAAIVRPGLVSTTYKDPFPGWIDTGTGITDIMVGVGRGLFRTCHVKTDVNVPIVPCDMCVNRMICVAWDAATNSDNTIKIYNSPAGTQNPIIWGEIYKLMKYYGYQNPISGMIWYPDFSMRKNLLENEIADFFCHYIPALFFHCMAMLFGKKSNVLAFYYKSRKQAKDMKAFMLDNLFDRTEYKNSLDLQNQLTPEDRKTFNFDLDDIDWPDYVRIFIEGGRKYYLKQDPSTIPQEKKNLQKLYWANLFLQMFILFCLFWMLYSMVTYIF